MGTPLQFCCLLNPNTLTCCCCVDYELVYAINNCHLDPGVLSFLLLLRTPYWKIVVILIKKKRTKKDCIYRFFPFAIVECFWRLIVRSRLHLLSASNWIIIMNSKYTWFPLRSRLSSLGSMPKSGTSVRLLLARIISSNVWYVVANICKLQWK